MTPGGAGAGAATGAPSAPPPPRFQGSTTFQHFAPHQGFYQPAGPLIRSASPGGTVAPPNAAPPTATVQPTVVTTQPSVKGSHPASVREGEFSPSQKDPGSPVKPTPQPPPSAAPTGVPSGAPTAPAFQPLGYPYGPYGGYTAAAAAATGVPPPPFYPPAPPPPAAAPFYGAPPHPYTPYIDHRGYPIYPSPFTPQYGSYYAVPALSYQPTSTATATTAASTTSTPAAGSQIALPHPPPPPPGIFYGAGAYTYPYSAAAAGRFVAPTLLTLQPQPAAVPTVPTVPPVPAVYPTYPPPPQPPTLAPQQLTPETPAAKNSQAGPQVVGKGSNSDNNPEIIAEVTVTPKTKKTEEMNNTAAKSSLRDYRKPTKPKQVAPAPPQVPTKSNAADYARALSGGEVSVTAVIGPKNPHPAPPVQQPPIVSMFPVPPSKPPVLTPEIVLPKKPVPPSVIANSVVKSNGVHNLPVLHIPEYTPFHKKKNRLPPAVPPPATSGSAPGHPGMPNGLLQLSTSLQQKGSTKVTPKDQNARVALSKIGLIETSPITVSMAKSAASAVTVNRVRLKYI